MFVGGNSTPHPVSYFKLEIILQIRFFYNSWTYKQTSSFGELVRYTDHPLQKFSITDAS